MKQISILTSFLFLGFINLQAQTTFDWDTAPIDNGDNVTETINGITTTFTGSSSTGIINGNGYGGSSDNIVFSSADGSEITTNVTFNFSESVDITSIIAFEGGANNLDFTFTPVGGNNPTVVVFLIHGTAQVNLNWTNVTSFTVSSTWFDGNTFGFDNLVLTNSTLSTNDFKLKTLNIFPNPSCDFIIINGLSIIENYRIYNVLGKEVKKGTVTENEKIDVQNLTNGLYFLKFEDENTLKFIKE